MSRPLRAAHSFHTKLCGAPHHYHLALAALQPLAAHAGPVRRLLIEGHELVDQRGGRGRQRNGDRGGGDVGPFIGIMSALRAPPRRVILKAVRPDSDANPLVTNSRSSTLRVTSSERRAANAKASNWIARSRSPARPRPTSVAIPIVFSDVDA
jgi:hypothetical protein